MSHRAFSHVHSEASGDSDLRLVGIRDAARRYGVSVVLVTEHREALDDAGIRAVAERCRDLSDERVRLVPGLEIATVERWHVLAFGLTTGLPRRPGAELADRIRDAGAYPVLAHPSRYGPGWEADLARIGAVEVWNRHYDGRLAPDPGAVRALAGAAGVRATFGLDAHGEPAFTGRLPELLLDAPGEGAPGEGVVLAALAAGRFTTARAGRAVDPLAASPLRRALGGAYRGGRRAARLLSRCLPISGEVRRRWGRRW